MSIRECTTHHEACDCISAQHEAELAALRAEVEKLTKHADELAKSEFRLIAEVERLTRERDEARDLVPHQGDGSCDNCGTVPSVDIPTRLCDECCDGVKRAEAAEKALAEVVAAAREYREMLLRVERSDELTLPQIVEIGSLATRVESRLDAVLAKHAKVTP